MRHKVLANNKFISFQFTYWRFVHLKKSVEKVCATLISIPNAITIYTNCWTKEIFKRLYDGITNIKLKVTYLLKGEYRKINVIVWEMCASLHNIHSLIYDDEEMVCPREYKMFVYEKW